MIDRPCSYDITPQRCVELALGEGCLVGLDCVIMLSASHYSHVEHPVEHQFSIANAVGHPVVWTLLQCVQCVGFNASNDTLDMCNDGRWHGTVA